MMIRLLREEDYEQAIDLKVRCWDEELAGVAPNRLNKEEERNFLKEWVDSAEENNDIRIVYGAFDDDQFMGFAGASKAEETDSLSGMELNYLFIHEKYRGRGISLLLIRRLIDDFLGEGVKEMVVYNHHFAPSNKFYTKMGGKVVRKDIQGKDRLHIDIFLFSLNDLKRKIDGRSYKI